MVSTDVTDVLVVGGSAAGLTAAITAKRHYPEKKVTIVRKEEKVLIPCGIPYIFGTVGGPDNNIIPDGMLDNNDIGLIVDEVKRLEPNNHVAETAGAKRIKYERLIIASGSQPLVPPIPGVELANVFNIQKDVNYLQDMMEKLKDASSLVIVGCGFIGVELAEEIKKMKGDMKISIVEMLKHCLQLVYDEEFCIEAENGLQKQGINIMLDEKVEAFTGNGKLESVKLVGDKEIKADAAILGIGSVSNTALAEEAGLEIGASGGIQVNRYMQTSDDHIFACGDCAEKVSFFDGKRSGLKLASIAAMEARHAGANLYGPRRINMGVIGVFSTMLNNHTYAAAGLGAYEAKQKGYQIIVGESKSPNRHPGGMPGTEPLGVKLVFEAGSQVLLGGQVTGAASGGELINAISAFIHQRMTADDIATFQMGTHPALTASPIAYQLVNAAEMAIAQSRKQSAYYAA